MTGADTVKCFMGVDPGLGRRHCVLYFPAERDFASVYDMPVAGKEIDVAGIAPAGRASLCPTRPSSRPSTPCRGKACRRPSGSGVAYGAVLGVLGACHIETHLVYAETLAETFPSDRRRQGAKPRPGAAAVPGAGRDVREEEERKPRRGRADRTLRRRNIRRYQMKIERHSPSSLNLFSASPSMYVLERILGQKQPVGTVAHRGTAVEDGRNGRLTGPRRIHRFMHRSTRSRSTTPSSALSSDARREDHRETIPAMVTTALAELRPYGVPSGTQGFVEWRPEGLAYPIVGYFDYYWLDHNITVDLKTSEKLPSSVKIAHARQISLYCTSNNADGRAVYITPKKHATYRVDNINEHRNALFKIAQRCEAFLALSDSPEFFTTITVPDLDSFYWSSPTARQLAFSIWGV